MPNPRDHRLIIVVGPTAAGKTSHAIDLARHYDTEIVSCDSRQFYRELRIGVARPSDEELAAAPHHFIACRPVAEPYNVFEYERDALSLIHRLFNHHPTVVAVGGSGLYIDALRQGVAFGFFAFKIIVLIAVQRDLFPWKTVRLSGG